MTPAPHIVIRADAGRAIGSGHIRRCLTLAARLQLAGRQVAFATTRDSALLVPDLADQTCIPVSGNAEREPDELRAACPGGVDLLVVDHYARDAHFESACRNWAKRIMVIDDLADRAHDADLLVDMTLDRRPETYAALLPETAVCLTGTDYALLRPEFADLREAALSRRAATTPVTNILVSVGATDQSGVMRTLLAGVAEAGFSGQVCVVGAADDIGNHYPFDLDVTPQAHDMSARMMAADLSIGACGMTSWERCCLGLPTIAVITADNQRDIARSLARVGAVALIETISASEIHTATLRLCENLPVRQHMSRAAAAVCDGRGAGRVVDALLPLVTSRSPEQADA